MPRSTARACLALLSWLAVCTACSRAPTAFARPATAPQRIVAGSVLAAEVLIEIAPRDRIAGVHELAANPMFSLVADRVGGLPLLGADPEQLLAARPDLVILDAFTRSETVALLTRAGVPLLRTRDPADFADIAANIREIGAACHLEPAAEALVVAMEGRLAAVAAGGRELGGWRVMNLDGELNTLGRGSLFAAAVAAAGARSLAAENGVRQFRRLDVEAVLGWRPDAIVVSATPGVGTGAGDWLHQMPGIELLPCVGHGRVLAVPSALLATTSHHLVDTAEFLQQALRAWGRP